MDKKAGTEIRASAQGLIALVTYGLGIGIGSVISGQIVDLFTVDGVKDWSSIWWVPAIFAAVVTLFFFFTFKDQKNQTEQV